MGGNMSGLLGGGTFRAGSTGAMGSTGDMGGTDTMGGSFCAGEGKKGFGLGQKAKIFLSRS